MTYPQVILLSAMLIAAAIIFASLSPVQSQGGGRDSYAISGDSGSFVWRVNQATGEVSYCFRRDSSLDPVYVGRQTPFCSMETPPME